MLFDRLCSKDSPLLLLMTENLHRLNNSQIKLMMGRLHPGHSTLISSAKAHDKNIQVIVYSHTACAKQALTNACAVSKKLSPKLAYFCLRWRTRLFSHTGCRRRYRIEQWKSAQGIHHTSHGANSTSCIINITILLPATCHLWKLVMIMIISTIDYLSENKMSSVVKC